MSGIYTGNPLAAFSPTVRTLTDDDPQQSTSYNPSLQTLEDNDANLNARLDRVEWLTPGAAVLYTQYPDLVRGFAETSWTKYDGFDAPFWQQSANTEHTLKFNISELVRYCRVSYISATIRPSSGHAGFPSPPHLDLVQVPRQRTAPNSAGTLLASAYPLDGMSVVTYEAGVVLSQNISPPISVNSQYDYFLRFHGESGASYVGGLVLQSLSFDVVREP